MRVGGEEKGWEGKMMMKKALKGDGKGRGNSMMKMKK